MFLYLNEMWLISKMIYVYFLYDDRSDKKNIVENRNYFVNKLIYLIVYITYCLNVFLKRQLPIVKSIAVSLTGQICGRSTIVPHSILPIVFVAPIVDINQKHSFSVMPLSMARSIINIYGTKNPIDVNTAFKINRGKYGNFISRTSSIVAKTIFM